MYVFYTGYFNTYYAYIFPDNVLMNVDFILISISQPKVFRGNVHHVKLGYVLFYSSLEIACDLRQGDGLCPIVFNIVLRAPAKAGIDTTATIINDSVQVLANADDIEIVNRTTKELESNYLQSNIQKIVANRQRVSYTLRMGNMMHRHCLNKY